MQCNLEVRREELIKLPTLLGTANMSSSGDVPGPAGKGATKRKDVTQQHVTIVPRGSLATLAYQFIVLITPGK